MSLDGEALRAWLESTVGLAVSIRVRESDQGAVYSIEPRGIDANEAFGVEVTLGWRSAIARIRPGNFARHLVEAMGRADPVCRATFCALAKSIQARGTTISFKVNELPQDPCVADAWPLAWQSLDLSLQGRPFDREHRIGNRDYAEVAILSEGALALALALAAEPEADVQQPVSDDDAIGFPEGAVLKVLVNRYERDRRNRALAIAAHGHTCHACGMDFEETYGIVGRGFIHVHHVRSISELGADYRINPVTDLVPVCANCHAMLHRTTPPMTVQELKGRIRGPTGPRLASRDATVDVAQNP